jgi:hypothetical protein
MKRGFDDSALPSEVCDELSRSRRAGHDYDVLGKLPQLRAALAASQATAGDDGLPEQEPASHLSRFNPRTSPLARAMWKITLITAAIGGSVFVAWPALRRQEAPEQSPRTQQSAEPAATKPATVTAPAPPAAVPEAPANEVVGSQTAPSPAPAARSSRREIAQLVRIRALLENDPVAAYRLAQRSEGEFPHGGLSEERQALQVLALAKSGNMETADRKALEFFARYPQSPMRELVEAALRR